MSIPLILFAKAPVAGQVKTRLQTHCSAEQAAEIAKILMEQTISSAKQYWPSDIFLYVWPDAEHDFLQRIINKNQLNVGIQANGDLGDKMHHALTEQGYPAAVMGCDVPHCPEQVYQQAYQLLQQGENVIGPSLDGGYYLLGLQQAQADLFKDMQWGGDTVLSKTLSKAGKIKLGLQSLPALNDIDEWSDLLEIAPQIPPLNRLLK